MRREVREIISSFRRGGRTETLVVLDAELRRVAPNGVLPGLVLGDLRWTCVAAMACRRTPYQYSEERLRGALLRIGRRLDDGRDEAPQEARDL